MSGPCYGRFQTEEAPSALLSMHVHDGTTALTTVDHETPVAVLDQSDLIEQGIHTSRFIPGSKTDATELGSCTFNTGIEAAAKLLPETGFLGLCQKLINSTYAEHPKTYVDTAGLERAAIAGYHQCTDQTGRPAEEWPPTDCGSTGAYVVELLKRLGVVKGATLATAGESLVSLMQTGLVMMGSPWFYKWEEPDTHGFIDGDGSTRAIRESIASGVAGGHETSLVAVEKIAFLASGHVNPAKTVIRGRNHWRADWGDHGCYRVHLSTLMAIGGQCDFRMLLA